MSKKTTKSLVPKLRFPEFRDTGEWSHKPIEALYSFKATNSYSRDMLNYEKGSVKNIHYGDIHTKFSTLFDIENEIVPFINASVSLEKIKSDNYCIEGDIVFADASEDLDDVGKSIEIVRLNNEKLLSGMHTLLARQKDIKLVVGFGGYLFKSSPIRAQVKKEAQGTKVFGISAGRLSNIEISFPEDKREQQKIADCLSSIDELVIAQAQKVEALKAYKKSLMQQLFPAEGETLPKLRFPEFRNAGEWGLRVLGGFVTERIEYPKVALPLFSLTIEDGVTAKTARYERSFLVNDEENAYKAILPNDFAYNPMNLRFGAIARYSGDRHIALSKYYNIFYCDQTVDSVFCEIYFRSHRMIKFYDRMATGSLIEKRRVHFSDFIDFNIPFPSLPEQRKIADCLLSIDDLITAQTQKVETLKSHKIGLMQQLFPAEIMADSKGL